MPSRLLVACLLALITSPLGAAVIEIAAWNTVNNPDDAVERELFRTVLSGIGDTATRRLSILAISETDQTSAPAIAAIMNSIYATTTYQAVSSTPDGGNDRTGFIFDTAAVTLLDSKSLSSGLTHHVLVGRFQPVDLPEDMFVYSTHLKSGASTSDRTLRGTEATIIRNHADALGEGRNVVVLGDFNMHGSSESAWSALVAPGNAALADLANAPGAWRDNPAFLRLHTQDPRTSMDDRFDIAFASGELFDGRGIDYTPSSFRVFGNNGTHLLGQPITTGTGAPSNVLLALSLASDHLPIVAEFNYTAIPEDQRARIWTGDFNSNWSAEANWTPSVPNGPAHRAAFGSSGRRTVTLDVPVTIGRLDLDDTQGYTITGESELRFAGVNVEPWISVASGNHTISAPVFLAHNTDITVFSDSSLSITGLLNSTTVNLEKSGPGTLTVNNVRAAGLSITGGTVVIAPNGTNASTSAVGSLQMHGGAIPPAKLDLADNAFIIDNDDASINATMIRGGILTGRGGSGFGKTWNGRGITSSTAAAAEPESRSVGYAQNSTLPLGPYTTFRGQPVDETSLLLAYTRTGDANLDGIVNDEDVTIVGATYAPGVPQPHWALGDFDYNGFVDDDDVTLLGVFYDPNAAPLAVTAVPEPATATLFGVMTVVIAALAIRRK